MKVGSLFSGIGGMDLAAEWAGMKVIWQCEIDPFCRRVLKKHWPEVELHGDIKEIKGTDIERPDILIGGYPCQPYSEAGKQRGAADDRHLWPEFKRLIEEIRPNWVIGENVSNHVELGLDDVLSDLETIGYTAQAFIIPSCAVQAPHQRDRVFVVANSSSERLQKSNKHTQFMFEDKKSDPGTWNGRRLDQPGIQRVVDGVSDQLDRLKCLGNAVNPYQIYPIFKAIMDVEKSL